MDSVLVVDYGMGNLRSVANAFCAVGAEPRVSADPRDADEAERIVLPGVGAFGDAMVKLQSAGWPEALQRNVIERGKPFLGLCVGLQVLATTGTEHGVHPGLGWIPGTVVRMQGGDGVRVPHIGWNDVTITRSDGILSGLDSGATFYFVHSYVFQPEDASVVSGICNHGAPFAAVLERGNLFATQFHPEKSQKAGLQVLRRFLQLTRGTC